MSRAHRLSGADLERAVDLRERDGLSFERIGKLFGVSEASAGNAVIAALCVRKGFRPAERDERGRLLPAEIERLRVMLRKGLKGVEIQLRMGVSAAAVAEQRHRYNRDLKGRGKALLPPPGNGERYSGARVPASTKREVEKLFMDGFGNQKIKDATGVSVTQIGRIRARLVARLKRKGERLPGCDAKGKRRVIKESARYIPEASIQSLRELLMQRVPTARAAKIAGIGQSSAYRIRDALRAELEAKGETLPPPALPGRVKDHHHPAKLAGWLKPEDRTRYRVLVREMGEQAARVAIKAEYAAAREQERSDDPFARQLELVRNGAGLSVKIPIRRADPTGTLGGISSAGLEAAA